jgi:hypothetical protein
MRKRYLRADLAQGGYLDWRRKATDRIYEALDRYTRFCIGQFAGMGESLSVEAIRFACEADRIPRGRWADVAAELNIIHQKVMERAERPKSNA